MVIETPSFVFSCGLFLAVIFSATVGVVSGAEKGRMFESFAVTGVKGPKSNLKCLSES